MDKPIKTEHSGEKSSENVKQSKQLTLDSLLEMPTKESVRTVEPREKKRIVVIEIEALTREDELALKIGFRLFPSKAAFSKITMDLYFDGQRVNSSNVIIPQGPLSRDDFELTPELDMKGIGAGSHSIMVEMCELLSKEKLNCTSKEVAVNYVPKRKEDVLVKVPFVKNIVGTDLMIVSDSEKSIYREIEESMKKESISKRDEY